MPYLSEILISVLNARETTSRDVSHLVQRWELAEATIGQNRGWHLMSDLSYIESENAWAHVDEVCECEHCSESVLSDSTREVHRINMRGNRVEQTWCETCEDRDSFYCRACDRTFSDDDSRETIHGDLVCSQCYSEEEEREEEEQEDDAALLPSYHNARRPYSPFDLQTQRVYSVELEIESLQRNALLIHLTANPIERTVWESDGSLQEGKGVEFLVCFQQDPERLKSVLSQLVDATKKFQATSWANTRCGCHINSNKPRNLWTSSRVMKLLWLVRQFKTTLQTISGRDSNHYCSWNNLPSLRSWSLGYCEKYTCVRVGCDRIEWRMFRGTLNKARLNLYIDVVRLLEDYALTHSIHELRERHHEIAINLHALTETAKKNGARI
jgi:hypothetical protein